MLHRCDIPIKSLPTTPSICLDCRQQSDGSDRAVTAEGYPFVMRQDRGYLSGDHLPNKPITLGFQSRLSQLID